jgi:hypothetical protein
MNIYVASSWRNVVQPAVVHALRAFGHEVYDFRHPAPGNTGFSWSEIDPHWRQWTPDDYRKALHHPIAMKGYALDVGALQSCDACVLVLPSGRSASWEFGYAVGQGKRGYVLQLEKEEPELMYSEATILTTFTELYDHFGSSDHGLFRDPPRSVSPVMSEERNCQNCLHQCMDMDMDLYCAAVNKPWGRVLHRGKPVECGPDSKLWEKDERVRTQ